MMPGLLLCTQNWWSKDGPWAPFWRNGFLMPLRVMNMRQTVPPSCGNAFRVLVAFHETDGRINPLLVLGPHRSFWPALIATITAPAIDFRRHQPTMRHYGPVSQWHQADPGSFRKGVRMCNTCGCRSGKKTMPATQSKSKSSTKSKPKPKKK